MTRGKWLVVTLCDNACDRYIEYLAGLIIRRSCCTYGNIKRAIEAKSVDISLISSNLSEISTFYR
jgi:hypothetical protein